MAINSFYPKGYHDVAITFLLVVGEVLGYHIMQRLSISHLREFMAPTMDKTTYLLHYMYPLVNILAELETQQSFCQIYLSRELPSDSEAQSRGARLPGAVRGWDDIRVAVDDHLVRPRAARLRRRRPSLRLLPLKSEHSRNEAQRIAPKNADALQVSENQLHFRVKICRRLSVKENVVG